MTSPQKKFIDTWVRNPVGDPLMNFPLIINVSEDLFIINCLRKRQVAAFLYIVNPASAPGSAFDDFHLGNIRQAPKLYKSSC